jgi:hypothetical protein
MMNENLKWIITCFIFALSFFVSFFVIGYISGLSIPEHATFGLDEETRLLMDKIYNNNCVCNQSERGIDYNAPFKNERYGIGGINV